LFEALHEPMSRWAWWAVDPIDGRHRYHEALGRSVLKLDFNKRAACQVGLDDVQRQRTISEPCTQKRKLGPKVR